LRRRTKWLISTSLAKVHAAVSTVSVERLAACAQRSPLTRERCRFFFIIVMESTT